MLMNVLSSYGYVGSSSGGLGTVLFYWIFFFVIGLVVILLYGYLWNYYIIKELREMNKTLRNMTDVMGVGMKNISMSSSQPQSPPHPPYQLRDNPNQQQGLNNDYYPR